MCLPWRSLAKVTRNLLCSPEQQSLRPRAVSWAPAEETGPVLGACAAFREVPDVTLGS